jgi:exopolyphosphatase/guanosine-5'-triphosphate,3'-diphosphate pyrophosphatase
MRCACVDIGANTTRLLVAEPDPPNGLRTVLAKRLFSPLRADREPADPLDEAEIAALAEQVSGHVALAREHGAEQVAVVATAVLRSAGNRDHVAAIIGGRAGEPLQLLDGHAEARLVFAGALASMAEPPAGEVAVVDIGGGSTEVAVGTAAAGSRWSASAQIGSRVLTAAHVRHDPPTRGELRAVRADSVAALDEVRPPPVDDAYAVGGDATSLRRLVGPVLDAESLTAALDAVCSAPADEVAERLGLHPRRARVLPAALLLLEAATVALKAPLRLCGGGLREGVIRELLRECDHGEGT